MIYLPGAIRCRKFVVQNNIVLLLGFLLVSCGPSVSNTDTQTAKTTSSNSSEASTAQGTFNTHGREDVSQYTLNLEQPFGCPINPANLQMMQPIQWPAEKLSKRWGAKGLRYSDVPTSMAVPAERCGAKDSYDFISKLTCDDDTRPLPQLEDAQAARVGSMGAGGSCGLIIDQYVVKCPEATYKIFVDMYHCPVGQSLF